MTITPALLCALLVLGALFWSATLSGAVRPLGISRTCEKRDGTGSCVPCLSAFAGIVALAAMILYRAPAGAANLAIVPDSEEYVSGALRILQNGTYDIMLNGDSALPARYTPWFSIFCLLPGYLVAGGAPGNGIYGIFICAMLGALAAYSIGKRISGRAGSICSVLGLLLLPGYRYYSHEIMTEIPSVALWLIAALIYMQECDEEHGPCRLTHFGLVLGFAVALRPTNIALALPLLFWLGGRGRLDVSAFLRIGLPSLGMVVLTLLYNCATFGSAFRSGYNFWAAVPYDYWNLTFSAAYIPTNLRALVLTTIAPAYLVAVPLVMDKGEINLFDSHGSGAARNLIVFAGIAGLGLTACYIAYFYNTTRFYMPLEALIVVLCGAIAGAALRRAGFPEWMFRFAPLALVLICSLRMAPEPEGRRLAAADRIRTLIPENATVISGLDPVYLRIINGFESNRTFLPVSRRVEYASKLISWTRVDHPDPLPKHALEHRAPGLLAGGARDAVQVVALEELKELKRQVAEGQPIFIDTAFVELGELEQFKSEFELKPIGAELFALRPFSHTFYAGERTSYGVIRSGGIF